MLVPLCNCNRHFSFLPSKTLLNPSFPIQNCHYSNLRFKSLRRRTSISAAAAAEAASADSGTLPQSAIQRIAEKLRSLGYVEESVDDIDDTPEEPSISSPNSPGEIFVPLPTSLPKYRVGHTLDPSWSTPENPVPEPGSGKVIQRFHEVRRAVLDEEERIGKRKEGKKEGAPSLAELTLPEKELRRLRSEGIGLRKKLKVGRAGITEGIVNGIHERWRRNELVKITCEDICRINMKRTHDVLERKTGGLVIWRSGSNIILYRGPNYKYPYFLNDHNSSDASSSDDSRGSDMDRRILSETSVRSSVTNAVESSGLNSSRNSHPPIIQGVGLPNRVRFQLPGEAQIAEEADALLEGLGPRYHDWWGYAPLPVDADLLPAVVTGYKRPFRLLPYGVKPKLTNDEMTTLKRLARPLPCHFALGRNRKHQGLAASIIKLWEKCEIAKIAVKRGVQNTNSELMAEELKWLTGGTLLSRDREFIVFYRGKDFLPAAASSAIEERRKYGMDVGKTNTLHNLEGEKHQHGVKESINVVENKEENEEHSEERKRSFSEAAMKKTSTKLSVVLAKKARAEKLLADLEKEEARQPPETDKEGITEEERYMLRKVGLRMKPFLLLGRRGVFDGTVENMHLHWKYRELVKVCIGNRSIEEVHGIARTLEAESGGILVAVEQVSKGYAIIVYRGKNYKRPASLRPRTLLSKREAMKRSLEAQRRESLKLHVLKLSKNIEDLRLKMGKDEDTNDMPVEKSLKNKFVKEQEINANQNEAPPSNDQSYFVDAVHEKAGDSLGADASSMEPVDLMYASKDSEHAVEQELPGDVSSFSEAKRNYLFETTAQEPSSVINESKGSLEVNGKNGNSEPSHDPRMRDGMSSATSSSIQHYTRVLDFGNSYQNAKLNLSVQKSMAERPAAVSFRDSQLSNKERLLLRKQALKMIKRPVLAIGKSNVVTGVAKAIKAHFEKHPLAIVNIKGRAKGTSVQEVIYNLEQATGAVLVSQEPSKVILYRGWGAEVETGRARNDSGNGHVMARPPISPELLSAIRLECGLSSANEESDVSKL